MSFQDWLPMGFPPLQQVLPRMPMGAPAMPVVPPTPARPPPTTVAPMVIQGPPGSENPAGLPLQLEPQIAPAVIEGPPGSDYKPQPQTVGSPAPAGTPRPPRDSRTPLQRESDTLQERGHELANENTRWAADQALLAQQEAEHRQTRFDEAYAGAQAELKRISAQREQVWDNLSRLEIDPNRYFKSGSAASNFLTGLAFAISAMGTGAAMDQFNKAIDRDIDAQKFQLGKLMQQNNMVGATMEDKTRILNEMKIAEADKRAHFWDMTERRLKAQGLQRGIPEGDVKFQQTMNSVKMQREAEQQKAQQAAAAQGLAVAKAKAARVDKARTDLLELAKSGMLPQGTNLAQIEAASQVMGGGLPASSLPGALGTLTVGSKPKGSDDIRLEREAKAAERAFVNGMSIALRTADLADNGWRLVPGRKEWAAYNSNAQQIAIEVSKAVPGLKSDKDTLRILEGYIANIFDSDMGKMDKLESIKSMLSGSLPDELVPQLAQEARERSRVGR